MTGWDRGRKGGEEGESERGMSAGGGGGGPSFEKFLNLL